MGKIPLKKIYLTTWVIVSVLFIIIYISSGATEGYLIPILLEIIFAAIASIIPPIIYFIFTHKEKE